MKKVALVFLLLLTVLLVAGCTGGVDDGLPEQPLEFVLGNFVNPADKEDTYGSVEYNGRTYIPCGTLSGTLKETDVGACLGYLVRENNGEEEKVEEIRFFPLTADSSETFLLCLDKREFMDQPVFFRAVDTVGKEIVYPDFIRPSKDAFWK